MAELNHLNENMMFEQLEQRVKDQTFDNLMLDAYDRPMKPMEPIPRDVFRLIMIATDTPTILKASSTCMDIQKLVLDDSFWKAKFLHDFPETGIKEIPEWAFEYRETTALQKRFQSQPWRRLYNVMYRVIFALKVYFCKLVQPDHHNSKIHFNVTLIDIHTCKCITRLGSKVLTPILIGFNNVQRKIAKYSECYVVRCAANEQCRKFFDELYFHGDMNVENIQRFFNRSYGKHDMNAVIAYLNTIKNRKPSLSFPLSYYFNLGYIPK
jgi:hypothetical protein